jgi:hypothetical protein
MSKLQNFAYKSPLTKAGMPSSQEVEEGVIDPTTPMPERVPLSDLISNTPRRQDGGPDVSPQDKVVWKLSPSKILEGLSGSQETDNTTKFINFLNNDGIKKNVYRR